MYEDREGVRADSQHENVLMEMELAAGAGNQASELPISPARAISRPEVCRKVFRPGVRRRPCSLSSPPTGVVTCARSLTGRVSGGMGWGVPYS